MPQDNYLNSIEQKFHDSGDLFALRYNEGLVFLEVENWEQTKFAPHNRTGTAPAGGGTGFSRIENDDDDDILYVDKKKERVKHVGIGHSPAVLRRYTNYPESENRLRRVPNLGAPVPGDDFGYVDGTDTPYHDPTDIEELYVPPGQHIDFNHFNPDTEDHEVILDIVMRVYNIRPLDPSSEEGRNAVRRIMSAGSPMPIANVGSINSQARYQLQDSWGVQPITADQARRL